MTKNTFYKNIFFKTDHTGKRTPSVVMWMLICAAVFGSYFLSQNKNRKTIKKTNQSIIRERDIIEASNVPLNKEQKKSVDLSKMFKFSESSTIRKTSPAKMPKFRSQADSKIIVFDDTQNYQSENIVPLGSMIKCLLIHNIVTNNFKSPVVVQVWENFNFGGKLLLPFGTRIYGTARAGRERDRILVTFHTIMFQDGKEVKIKALGLSEDGSAGLTGWIVNKHNKKLIIEMVLNFFSGLALGLQETATNAVTSLPQVTVSSRNAVLEGVGNTFNKEAKRIQKDLDKADGYAIVTAGTELVVYFEKSTDMKPL